MFGIGVVAFSSVSVYFLSIPEFLVNVYGKVVFLHLHLFYLIKPHTQGQKSIPFTSFIYIVTDPYIPQLYCVLCSAIFNVLTDLLLMVFIYECNLHCKPI